MNLVSPFGFQINCLGNITCVAKTSNMDAQPGFPPSGEREGGLTITHVTDASGNIVNEYNFDAWGRRRNFTDWSYTVAAQTDILPDRGFTGHEYLPWFKLYNMNGRLYDPEMNGRDHCSRRFKTCILF